MSETLIPVNIYYGKDKKLMESFLIKIGEKITSIDGARLLIVNHLDNFYMDIKYKLNIFTTFDGRTTINLFFEEDTSLNREIILKKILE
jgi:hypothetical protein